MDAKQFAWVYLIENGLAAVEPSYYGGHEFVDDVSSVVKNPRNYSSIDTKAIRDLYLQNIKHFGVDWDKTYAPLGTLYRLFEGTFCESSELEYLTGTLVLKNGSEQFWCSEAIDVQNVFEILARIDSSKALYTEIFGE